MKLNSCYRVMFIRHCVYFFFQISAIKQNSNAIQNSAYLEDHFFDVSKMSKFILGFLGILSWKSCVYHTSSSVLFATATFSPKVPMDVALKALIEPLSDARYKKVHSGNDN